MPTPTDAPPVTLCGRHLGRPGHLCAFFDSRREEYDVLTPYFQEGLAHGEQVINIVDADRFEDHHQQLAARGVDVDNAVKSDSLKVLTAEDTYTAGGEFSSKRMYALLQDALAAAQFKGRRVRTSGVMDWASRGHAGTEELMDYEARVNVLVPQYDCTLLCVYDLAKLSGTMVMDILATHALVVRGKHVLENPYYVAPIDMLRSVLLDTTKAGASAGPQQLQ